MDPMLHLTELSNFQKWIVYAVCFPFVAGFLLMAVFIHLGYLQIAINRWIFGYPSSYNHICWNGARKKYSAFVQICGRIWHGFEVEGMENLPEGGALLVSYHGTKAYELWYILTYFVLNAHKNLCAVADRFIFKIPVLKEVCRFMGTAPLSMSEVVERLKEGRYVFLTPGGSLEAFHTNDYELMWKNRIGFARAAIEAKVPIIPIFTRNARETSRNLNFPKSLYRWFYEKTRLPLMPQYGGLPIKLKTYIGKPIPYDPKLTPEELAVKSALAIKSMIKKHQRIPGSVVMALVDRFVDDPKMKTS